jgi:hypothetical protein
VESWGEIWGLCGNCDRWFYCAGWFDRSKPSPVCPVCGAEPQAIENRASVSAIRPVAKVIRQPSALEVAG